MDIAMWQPIRIKGSDIKCTHKTPSSNGRDCMRLEFDDGNSYHYYYDGRPYYNGPLIENYEPEVENKPMTVDWTKPIQTRDGRPARVLCTDLKSPNELRVVIAVLLTDGKREDVWYRPPCGKFYGMNKESPTDIINVPEKRTVYINIYSPNDMVLHTTKEAAEQCLVKDLCIARVKVEYTVGQFDI